MEQIVGEIDDEVRCRGKDLNIRKGRRSAVHGSWRHAPSMSFNEYFRLQPWSEEEGFRQHTVAGLLMKELGRLPRAR